VVANARIVSEFDDKRSIKLFLHIQIARTVPPVIGDLQNIIGVHLRRNGTAAYAVTTFAGNVVEVGDIPLPNNLLIDPKDPVYGDEYVYQMANTLVRLALRHHAIIALEDLSYLTQDVSSSHFIRRNHQSIWRAHNDRETALQLSTLGAEGSSSGEYIPLPQRVLEEVKTRLEAVTVNGMPSHKWLPQLPTHSVTGDKASKKGSRYINSLWVQGPSVSVGRFGAWQEVLTASQQVGELVVGQLPPSYRPERQCSGEADLVMHCRQCNTRMLAAHNTALITAQLGREQLVARYHGLKAKVT
jgi:hypothetical protein